MDADLFTPDQEAYIKKLIKQNELALYIESPTQLHSSLVYPRVDWQTPTLESSWVNFDTANYPAAGYGVTHEGVVVLRGLVKDGTIGGGNPIFTLPEEYRPDKIIHMATVSNGAFGYVRVLTTGVVDAPAGSNTWFSLNNIFFDLV